MKLHHERKLMRLPGYDYSMPGAYFVTTCAKNRELFFETSDATLAVESAWQRLLDIFADIELGEFAVLPNHIHCIVCIMRAGAYRLHPGTGKNDSVCRVGRPPDPTKATKYETLSNIIGAFKTTAATNINTLRGAIGTPVWQKSFYDRIVRNEQELERIQKYIQNNPFQWEEDRDNPFGSRFCLPATSIDDYWNEIFDCHM